MNTSQTSQIKETISQIIEKIGFDDFSVEANEESRRVSVLISDSKFFKDMLPYFVSDINYLVRLITKKQGWEDIIIDVNNYLKEREGLILELARAAARKSVATKEEISLPPMNSYERRLVHTELADRPDLKTESAGEGKDRYVVIKPL
ncbi:MAG: hypothetical protein NUV83_00630 [Candidatus Wolfebacteria bacterium]|nr:hypothetical protein [Candidatus Wolfebacteria bacterium]